MTVVLVEVVELALTAARTFLAAKRTWGDLNLAADVYQELFDDHRRSTEMEVGEHAVLFVVGLDVASKAYTASVVEDASSHVPTEEDIRDSVLTATLLHMSNRGVHDPAHVVSSFLIEVGRQLQRDDPSFYDRIEAVMDAMAGNTVTAYDPFYEALKEQLVLDEPTRAIMEALGLSQVLWTELVRAVSQGWMPARWEETRREATERKQVRSKYSSAFGYLHYGASTQLPITGKAIMFTKGQDSLGILLPGVGVSAPTFFTRQIPPVERSITSQMVEAYSAASTERRGYVYLPEIRRWAKLEQTYLDTSGKEPVRKLKYQSGVVESRRKDAAKTDEKGGKVKFAYETDDSQIDTLVEAGTTLLRRNQDKIKSALKKTAARARKRLKL